MSLEQSTDHNGLISWASEQAAMFLAPLGNRWLHVQGVVEQARQVGAILDIEDRVYLLAGAYLHDIGYAPSLQRTGFHPLDGAYFLRSHNQDRLASLVAYHSEAQQEARLRGLYQELAQFPRETSAVADALTYCDMTTNAVGLSVSFQERIADILSRYPATSVVSQAIRQAQPALARAVTEIQKVREARIG
jgi:hypothetical protein